MLDKIVDSGGYAATDSREFMADDDDPKSIQTALRYVWYTLASNIVFSFCLCLFTAINPIDCPLAQQKLMN